MTGYEYERKCAKLLEEKGFTNVKVTPKSGDQGIDILAKKGLTKYGIQCKYYEGVVGNKAVQEAFSGASFYDCNVAMVITSSRLTAPAKTLAKKLGVEVWEGIDAVYLQKNDAEYQRRERERREQEALWRKQQEEAEKQKRKQQREAAKQQREQAFLEWKTAYGTAFELREKFAQSEMEKCNDKKRKLTMQYEEISAEIFKLSLDQDKCRTELKSAPLFQFSYKKQLKQRIAELDAQIAEQNTLLEHSKLDLQNWEQECLSKAAQIETASKIKYPLPPFPQNLNRIKEKFLRIEVWKQAERLAHQYDPIRPSNENLKRLLLLHLWVVEQGYYRGNDFWRIFYDTFGYAFGEMLLAQLESEHKIKRIGENSYSVMDSCIADIEKAALAELCKYSADNIEKLQTAKKKELSFSFALYDERQFREIVCKEVMKAEKIECEELENKIFDNISKDKTREVIRDLKERGIIERRFSPFIGYYYTKGKNFEEIEKYIQGCR